MAANAGFAHLPQDVRPIAALDAEARIHAERWVQNPAADRVLGYLHEASTQPRRERMENILLIGESGMGKTMLIRKFERQTAVAFDDGAGVQQRPVVVMLMPHEPTERAFFVQLLQAMHAPPGAHLNSGYPVQAVVMRLLGELQTRLVVIDEINSVLAGTPRQQRIFLQLLRFMSNELRLAFVGVGVPEARHALLSDSQLRSRFTDVELLPWTDGEALRGFVNRLAWSLPLREPSPVDSSKLRRLLVERTGGVTLGICKALERAAVAAIRGGTERIGLESVDDPEIWRGVAAPTRDTRPQGHAGAVRQGA